MEYGIILHDDWKRHLSCNGAKDDVDVSKAYDYIILDHGGTYFLKIPAGWDSVSLIHKLM